MPAWVSDEWEWTEHVESMDVVELDLIYLGDINTLRKQVYKHFYPPLHLSFKAKLQYGNNAIFWPALLFKHDEAIVENSGLQSNFACRLKV